MKLVIDSDAGPRIVLVQEDGRVSVVECSPDMEMVAERWISEGLNDTVHRNVGDQVTSRQRRTPPGHPQFLPRIRDFISRNFQFRVALSDA